MKNRIFTGGVHRDEINKKLETIKSDIQYEKIVKPTIGHSAMSQPVKRKTNDYNQDPTLKHTQDYHMTKSLKKNYGTQKKSEPFSYWS